MSPTRQHLPPPTSYGDYKTRVRDLCVIMQCSTTSGARTEKRNLAKGGDGNSKHLLKFGCWADDLAPDNNVLAVRLQVRETAKVMGLWAHVEDDHVHVQGLPLGAGTTPWGEAPL